MVFSTSTKGYYARSPSTYARSARIVAAARTVNHVLPSPSASYSSVYDNGVGQRSLRRMYWAATGCTATLPSTCQPQGLLNAARARPVDRRGAHALERVCNNLLPNTDPFVEQPYDIMLLFDAT